MGRCLAWFFEYRSYLAHLGSIIVLIVNSFFFIYLHVNDPNKDYNNNNNKRVKGRKSLPWVTNAIHYLIKKKITCTLRKRIKKSTFQSEHLITKFKDLRSRIKRMLLTIALNI